MIKNTGRIVGLLLFVQFFALMTGFILLRPGILSDYLQAAAALEGRLRLAVGLLMLTSAVTISIAVFLISTIRNHIGAAVLVLMATVLWVVFQSIDDVHIMSMLSLSKDYANGTGGHPDIFNILAEQVRSTRGYAHYMELLMFDVWYAVVFGVLFAYRLIPRSLGAFTLLMVVLHLIGLPAAMYAGYPLISELAYGLIAAYVVIGGWLVAWGFPEPTQSATA